MQLTPEQEYTYELARVAYGSYCANTNWKSVVTGDKLPSWEDLPVSVTNAWWAAAQGVAIHIAHHPFKDQ